MARTVLSVVAHHRMQGLIRENQALVEANRTLALRLAQANESGSRMEDTISDQSVAIAELVRQNGAQGISRPRLSGQLQVCGFCYDFLIPGTGNYVCQCKEHAYCSDDCKALHWRRHHRAVCPAASAWERLPPYEP